MADEAKRAQMPESDDEIDFSTQSGPELNERKDLQCSACSGGSSTRAR